jgi:hypothetical protein
VFVDNPELAATSPDPGPFLQPFAEAPHDAAAATFRTHTRNESECRC